MRNFTKKVVATTTAVLMSASVLAGTALAAGTGTANTAYQSLVDTVTSTKQVRNAFNAKSVARNAAKGTKKAGSTASLAANQIVTNVIKIKGAGAAAANGTTVSDKVAASKAAAAAANAAYTNAASGSASRISPRPQARCSDLTYRKVHTRTRSHRSSTTP